MQLCSACQKQPSQTVVLDVTQGSLSGKLHLCQACAEQLGFVAPKVQIKMTPELLEDMLAAAKSPAAKGRRDTACPGCGMTPTEFQQKGRLGCARCYESFRPDLVPLLQRVHEATVHRGRLPGSRPGTAAPAAPPANAPTAAAAADASADLLADLRRWLEDAIRGERYEEAARLRDRLRRAERGEPQP